EPSTLGLNGPAFAPLSHGAGSGLRTESHVEVEVTVARSQRKHKTLRLCRLNRTDCVSIVPTGPLSPDRVARPIYAGVPLAGLPARDPGRSPPRSASSLPGRRCRAPRGRTRPC